MRNNSIFGDGKCSVQQSANFIQAYLSSFLQIKDPELEREYKGKKPMFPEKVGVVKKPKKPPGTWMKPDVGWQKLNVDASFLQDKNNGTWGRYSETIMER